MCFLKPETAIQSTVFHPSSKTRGMYMPQNEHIFGSLISLSPDRKTNKILFWVFPSACSRVRLSVELKNLIFPAVFLVYTTCIAHVLYALVLAQTLSADINADPLVTLTLTS